MAKTRYILLLLAMLLCIQTMQAQPVKYASQMKVYLPHALTDLPLTYYYDYHEALAEGKRQNKPVMLFFTGINCVNCRKMEAAVWVKNGVVKRLRNNFIVALLYCDAQHIKLPANEQRYSKIYKKKIDNLGDENGDLQVSQFNANSQPTYFFVNGDGKKIIKEGYYYDTDVTKFMNLLDVVSAAFKKKGGQ